MTSSRQQSQQPITRTATSVDDPRKGVKGAKKEERLLHATEFRHFLLHNNGKNENWNSRLNIDKKALFGLYPVLIR